MARTPDAVVNGKPRKQITAFIVEANCAGSGDRPPMPVHGPQGDRERRRAVHERARAEREHPLGRREGAQARAHHAQHRAAHAARELRRRRQGDAAGRAHLGESARAVGSAHREARGRGAEDRAHGREHLRDGISRGARRRPRRAREVRHPPRGGDRQDVEHRDRLAHRRRHAADPGRSRLRDGRFAARVAASRRSPSSARCGTSASI